MCHVAQRQLPYSATQVWQHHVDTGPMRSPGRCCCTLQVRHGATTLELRWDLNPELVEGLFELAQKVHNEED